LKRRIFSELVAGTAIKFLKVLKWKGTEMEVTRDSLLSGAKAAKGTAVIIDVFRAFTCTPLFFSFGVKKAILVPTPEEAFALRKENKDLILSGEIAGVPIEGFDLGNSPSQILKQDPSLFEGKTVVQRSSAGVQGAVTALEAADEVLLCSFVLAAPTARYIIDRQPRRVSIVAMGRQLKERSPEDEWCATYVSHLLGNGSYDHNKALREIIFHQTTQKFLAPDIQYFPPEDPIVCLQRDIFEFALRAKKEDGQVMVRRVDLP